MPYRDIGWAIIEAGDDHAIHIVTVRPSLFVAIDRVQLDTDSVASNARPTEASLRLSVRRQLLEYAKKMLDDRQLDGACSLLDTYSKVCAQ